MKKFAFILSFAMLVMTMASCKAGDEGGRVMTEEDRKAMEAAEAAYTADGATAYMLCKTDAGFVTLHDGTALGVYDSKEAAMEALFDDPETEENEAAHYICLQRPGSDRYLCSRDFSTLTYVAFGDSITYGIDGNYRVGDANYRMAKPYPALVGETLKMHIVNNQGVSGASFCPHPQRANLTERMLNFSGDADIISLMLGVNDFTSKLPLGASGDRDHTTIYGCLYLISEHFTTLYPDAFIFYMTPFQYKNPHNGEYALEDVANAIKTVAAEYDIPVLDMYAEGKYENEMHVSPNDGVHPSQQHHIYYTAPLISEFLIRQYKWEK